MNKSNDQIGMSEIMKRAQDMQKKLQDIQQEVTKMEITGQSGGGMVRIAVNGAHYCNRVELDPNVLKEDRLILQDLIAAAINDATSKVERTLREKMGGLAGFKLPESGSN